MEQTAWYSPELNVIVFLTCMEGCYSAYEWGWEDLCEYNKKANELGLDDPMELGTWVPLGKL